MTLRSCHSVWRHFAFASLKPISSLDESSQRKGKKRRSKGRRETILKSITLFSLIGSDDPVTLLNGVLSGYGLPTLKESNGFKTYDRFEDDFTFEYPKSWVISRNRLREGLIISDFKTGDKIQIEIFPMSEEARSNRNAFVMEAIARIISPGAGQQNDRLELPSMEKVQITHSKIDDLEYVYFAFPSTTITRSGYQVKRLNAAVATERDSTVTVFCASTRSEEASSEKDAIFEYCVNSFRLR